MVASLMDKVLMCSGFCTHRRINLTSSTKDNKRQTPVVPILGCSLHKEQNGTMLQQLSLVFVSQSLFRMLPAVSYYRMCFLSGMKGITTPKAYLYIELTRLMNFENQ